MKYALAAAVLVFSFCWSLSLHADTVSGTVRYENKPYTASGFTGSTEYLPVRFADIEIVRSSDNAVLGSGETTSTGTYAIVIPNAGSQSMFIRVYPRQNNASYNIVVKNNSSGNQTYTATTSTASYDTDSPVAISLDITIAGGAAGVFNIFDVAIFSWALQATVDTLPGTLPQLLIYWESGSTNGTYFSGSQNAIYLLGRSSDPDEFDDDIVLHEIGHFIAKNFSKDNSPGGAHAITSQLDLRLAWSEGFAHYWSSAVRRFAGAGRYPAPESQVDNFGSGNSYFEIETPSFSSQTVMATNEVAIAAALWDISDTNNEGVDALALGDDEIWTVVNDDIPSRTQITLEDFFIAYIIRYPPDTISVTNILAGRSIKYSRDALDPSGLENNSSAAASALSGTVTANTFYPAGDQDWFSFSATAGDRLNIETLNLGDGCDTVLTLYDSTGATQLATNDDRTVGDLSSQIQYDVSTTGAYFLKVTPYSGAGQIAELGYYDLRLTVLSNAPPSIVSVTATQTTGAVPLLVGFTATASDTDGSIVLYQWDFTGDGRVDYTSRESATVSYSYAMAGTFNATLRVTDSSGASTSTTTTIVTTLSGSAPTLDVSVTVSGTTAPVTTTLTMTVTGVTPALYEWDFDSNGIIDYSSISSNTASTVYGIASSYLARGYVVDSEGRRHAADPKQVIVNAGSGPPTISDFTLSASSGNLPLSVNLTVLASDPGGSISKIEWDFEGDGQYDRQTISSQNVVTEIYKTPGVHTPQVRVTDNSGLQVTRTTSLTVTQFSTAGWIREPQINDTVSGEYVTLVAEVVTGGVSKTVQFQYRTDSPQGSWVNIGSAIDSTGTWFSTTWDIGSFSQFSVFDVRALINGSASTGDDSNTVTILSASPKIREYTESGGIAVKEKVIDITRTSELFLSTGAGAVFPLGCSDSGSDITVRIRNVGSNLFNAGGSSAGMVSINRNLDMTVLSGVSTFGNSFIIRVPYADADDNGYVDGTNVGANTLQVHWYSTGDGAWRRDMMSTVNSRTRIVEGTSTHMTEFGAFGSLNLGSGGGGGGGGGTCYTTSALSYTPATPAWPLLFLIPAVFWIIRNHLKRSARAD